MRAFLHTTAHVVPAPPAVAAFHCRTPTPHTLTRTLFCCPALPAVTLPFYALLRTALAAVYALVLCLPDLYTFHTTNHRLPATPPPFCARFVPRLRLSLRSHRALPAFTFARRFDFINSLPPPTHCQFFAVAFCRFRRRCKLYAAPRGCLIVCLLPFTRTPGHRCRHAFVPHASYVTVAFGYYRFPSRVRFVPFRVSVPSEPARAPFPLPLLLYTCLHLIPRTRDDVFRADFLFLIARCVADLI